MKLGDALRGMSSRSLAVYRAASGAALAETAELVARLTSPERVRRAVDGLSPPGRIALRILYLQRTPAMTPWAFRTVFERLAPGVGGERAVGELVDVALALPPLATGGQYAIPEEIRPALQSFADEVWLAESGGLDAPGVPPKVLAPAAPAAVLADFARLLGATGVAALRLRRQDGAPYQADQQRLLAAMDRASLPTLPDAAPAATTWEGYDATLAPLLIAGSALGVLIVRDGGWRASDRAQEWTDQPPPAQWRGLLRAWISLWADQADPLGPVCQTLWRCLLTGRWCRPATLTAWVARHLTEDGPSLPDAVHNLVVRTGVRMGALQWGGQDDGPGGAGACAVRMVPAALAALGEGVQASWPTEEAPLVQGTFQVVAGPHVAPATFRLLELWGERESLERFATYRLTQHSVRGAATRGLAPQALLAALAGSPGGVPQNVAYSIREWARPAARLVAEIGVILRPARADALEEADVSAVLPRAIALGPAAWLLPAGTLPESWEALERAGFQLSGDLEEMVARLRPRPEPGGNGTKAVTIPLPWPGAVPQVPWPEPEEGLG